MIKRKNPGLFISINKREKDAVVRGLTNLAGEFGMSNSEFVRMIALNGKVENDVLTVERNQPGLFARKFIVAANELAPKRLFVWALEYCGYDISFDNDANRIYLSRENSGDGNDYFLGSISMESESTYTMVVYYIENNVMGDHDFEREVGLYDLDENLTDSIESAIRLLNVLKGQFDALDAI